MSNILMVPVHLDALHLQNDKQVVSPDADFSRLPYSDYDSTKDGSGDVNPDNAFLGEEIAAKPFQNQNLLLKAGIHLHWSLPDALTHRSGTAFPAVPNRWLVIRGTTASPGDKKWVIESDYLYPPGQGQNSGSVSIPVPATASSKQPFRYLGRTMSYPVWKLKREVGDEFMSPFTAVGYGIPDFAAFYPNCRGIFGLHDPAYTTTIPAGLTYHVIGWYEDSNGDFAGKAIRDFLTGNSLPNNGTQTVNDQLVTFLKEEFKWEITVPDGTAFPDQTLCYSRLSITGTAGHGIDGSPVGVTVANTGTEALSAYVANFVDTSAGKTYKNIIEEQLEALHFASNLEHRQLDTGLKFLENRHEKGFIPTPSGCLWSVRPNPQTTGDVSAEDAQKQQQVTLPDDWAELLNQLNIRQRAYDSALAEIQTMRGQLFSDWYKYMICAYPPDGSRDEYPEIDAVKYYIENEIIVELDAKINSTGELTAAVDDDGKITGSTSTGTPSGSLASQLAQAMNDLYIAVNAHNSKTEVLDANTSWIVAKIPGPRFWKPREPVVLITGDAAEPTIRHGFDGRLSDDGLLACTVLTSGSSSANAFIKSGTDTVTQKMDALAPAAGTEKIGFGSQSKQPWHPLKLEWEVEVFPLRNQSNHGRDDGQYGRDFITDSYQLPANKTELVSWFGKGGMLKGANMYSGSSILTPHAGKQLKDSIITYIKKQDFLETYYQERSIAQDQQDIDHLGDQVTDVLSWFAGKYTLDTDEKKAKDPVYTALRAFKIIKDLKSLSQCLSGFNDALLMHLQTYQLKIDDLLAFDDYTGFTTKVRTKVDQYNIVAPQPLNDFNPIRTGAVELLRLRLVDTFGQTVPLNVDGVKTAGTLPILDSNRISLPPRFVQPAMLNFRWLSASHDTREMNAHPATTPVCGWVLANNLDNSLMVYDHNGKAIGYIDSGARWETPPGTALPYTVDSIENPHLRKMVKYILARGKTFLADFITTVDTALENIDPESFARHKDVAVLMGRPLALVRASVNLELMGRPAVHHGWDVFRRDIMTGGRDTNSFPNVDIPIRVGEYKQLNDGLVGFWKETADGYENDMFYASQSTDGTSGNIKAYASAPANINRSLVSPPLNLSMLVDPRGKVHATCGVLPAKAIDIPPDQYADALKNIEITFLSTPVLSGRNGMELALPKEGGYRWSWIGKDLSGEWTEIFTAPSIKYIDFIHKWGGDDAHAAWEYLEAETTGWLKPIEGNLTQAAVVPKDRRVKKTLDGDFAGKDDKVDAIFDRCRLKITPPVTKAEFAGNTQINEGWLKLSKDK